MKNSETKEFSFSSIDLIRFIYKVRRPLIIFTFIGAILAAAVSYTITPKFKSTVVMFPTTSISMSKSLLSTRGYIKESMAQYGDVEEIERMLQVLKSDIIRNKVVEKFDLLSHYEIDSTSAYPKTALYKIFNSNFEFKRTKFMGISITVFDHDAQMASDMANYIAELVDEVMNEMYKSRSRKAFAIVEKEYKEMEQHLKNIQDSIAMISKLGITDYESQSEVFNKTLAESIASGNTSAVRKLEKKIAVLEEYGARYLAYKNLLEFEIENLTDLRTKYAEAKVDATQNIPYKYIVDHAVKSERKATPIRWLIVFIATIATFTFTLLTLFLVHNFNQLSKLD